MSDNQLRKIAPQVLMHRTGRKLEITNKLLSLGMRQRITAITLKQPDFFSSLLSRYYHLPENLILKFYDIWNWQLLSNNEFLPWSMRLVEQYENKWDWHYLSINLSLSNLRDELKIKYASHDWNFRGGCNTSMIQSFFENWSIEDVETYDENDWHELSSDQSLPWSIEFIKQFENKWDWRYLSFNEYIPWSSDLITQFADKWDWRVLSYNKFIPWSSELIKKFEDKWDWKKLSGNDSIVWSIDLLSTYEEKWNWDELSNNKFSIWSIELLEKFDEKWNWHNLSNEEKVYQTIKSYLDNNFVEELLLKITEQE